MPLKNSKCKGAKMPTNQIINDVLPLTQLVATNAQVLFNTDWTAASTTDVVVYARAAGADVDDVTQLVPDTDYTVSFVGMSQTVDVTFLVGRTTGDIITIMRDTPADRLNLYSNTNFIPAMLNQDTAILTLVDQQAQLVNQRLAPKYNNSVTLTDPNDPEIDLILPLLGANQIWAKNDNNDEIIAYDVPASGSLAPGDATYILQTPDADLPNAQAMGSLATGLVVNTSSTGVQLTRVLTGTTNQTTVTNGNGLSGNPTVAIANNPILPGTEYFKPPQGTTAERPVSPANGMVRFNTDLNALEVYEGSAWDTLSGGLVDTVTGTANEIDVDNTDPANPVLSLSATLDAPGTFTVQGTISIDSIIDDDTFATATDSNIPTAESVKAYVDSFGPGIVTAVDGTTNEIDVDSTDPAVPVVGLASNPVVPGTASMTVPKGTVAQRAGASGSIRFNTDSNLFEVTVNGTDWVTLDTHTGGDVDSIIGTANQVIASSPTGNVTLSLPQSIATTSDVTFGSVTFSPTTKGIVGTTTNNNAGTGYVGEFVESNIPVASSVGITTNTDSNITSISLTAGDWEIFGNVGVSAGNASTSLNYFYGWVSATSATQPNLSRLASQIYPPLTGFNAITPCLTTPSIRVSLASTTTIYLSVKAVFTVSTCSAFGTIIARRMR